MTTPILVALIWNKINKRKGADENREPETFLHRRPTDASSAQRSCSRTLVTKAASSRIDLEEEAPLTLSNGITSVYMHIGVLVGIIRIPVLPSSAKVAFGIRKMPRKVDYGFRYEDDNYDVYEDYDYDYADDYDYEEEENGIAPVTKAKQEASRTGVWRCPICTYDNENSMSACDICGVLRNPLVKVNNKGDTAAVGGICKDSGASVMAMSLFASSPQHMAKMPILFEAQKSVSSTDDHLNFHKDGNFRGTFQEFNSAFSSQNHHKVNIAAAFKFDAPSPDDLVSNGLRSVKSKSKGISFTVQSASPGFVFIKHNPTNCYLGLGKARVVLMRPWLMVNLVIIWLGSVAGQDVFFLFLAELVALRWKDKKLSIEHLPLIKITCRTGSTVLCSFWCLARSDIASFLLGENFNKSYVIGEDSRGRGTNFLVESELAANGLVSSSTSVTRERHNGVEENDSTSGSGNKPETFNTRMDTESLPSKSGKARSIIERKTESISQYIPEKWMTPNNKDDGLSQLNLAIVGHVDSGKSTLSGRMLHLLGRISQKEMHKYEKEAKQQGKGSFAFAWALDESAEERERGITMTVGVAFFTSRKYHVVLLDSPGHRDFVPNMISGATQADAAILVVDASMGSFEAGIDAIGGQTREHAQLIRSFGVDQIIIVVNKMDVVEYSKERFDVIKQKLGTFLRSCGFKDSSILWIPASAMENQNLVANPSEARLSWFKGPSLLDAIDSLQLPERDYSKPLLMPICDVIKSQSQGQVTACGKLESGAIRTGSKVLVMPSGITATARSLERDSQLCNIARAGDNVTVNLQGIEGNQVTAGGVICHPDYPVQVTNRLQLKILVLDISTPIVMGSQLEFHIHHAKEAARIVKILSLLDPKTGNTTKKSPRCLLAKQNAIVEVVLQGPVCVEEYSSCRALGRVFLRSSGRTIALGIVTQIPSILRLVMGLGKGNSQVSTILNPAFTCG
ncbi:UNVERIFIED_CONTAM: HBS1-like protein [Sesamum indicum]